MRDPLHLGLAVRERAVRFHKITVREISGGGTLEAGGATSITSAAKAADPEHRTIDLLPLVDVKRNALAGDWSRDGMDLLVQAAKSDSSGSPRLQLPYQPPEEYDFEIEFTPESGTNSVSQLLSAYQRTFAWQVDVKLSTGMKTGFAQIGGKSLIGTTDGNVMRPGFLTNGRRHRSTVEVRRTGLRGLLDGQQVVSWGANPESYQALDIHPNDALRDALHLGIGGYDRAVRFHKITVREISGTGKVDALPAGIVPASASGSAPPNFTTWKDVTTEMRDRARGVAGVVVEADAVRIAPGATSTPVIPITTTGMPDCAVRLRHAGGGQVNLRVNPDGFLFVLCQRDQTIFKRYDKAAPTSAVIAPSALHPAGFDYEARHETIVTIEGSTIRAWVDGRFVGEAQDTKFPTGTVGLALMPSTAIYQVEIADLTPSPAAAGPVVNSGTIDWLKRDVWSAPFVLENGVLKSTKDAVMPIGTMGDGTIRMRLRDVGTAVTSGAPSLQIKVRSTPLATDKWGNYQLQIFPGRSTCNLIYIDKNLTTGVESTDALWKDKPLPSVPGHPKEFEFEFRTEGETLSVSAGGQTVASVRDSRLSTGTISIVSNPTIEITRFETVGATNSKLAAEVSANTPPTPTAGWQDVTSTMREKLRSKPGISVEANEVRRTSNDGAVVNAKLSDETTRDRVLRVRFTHNVQVSLWSATGAGSVAVLVLSNRTIFQRQVTATGSAERFGPDMPHPNGYDVLQPHELIVAVQGSTVRAWLNGRFTGEAEDDLIKGRFFGLGFFPQTAVQKVEIGEVNAATETSNLQWTDWLGPKLASGQSLPAGWKVDGSGVTMDRPIGGTNVVQDVKDAAVRVSYDLRDSQGIQITMRESKAGGSRDMYFADDTGDTLYIARLKGTEVKSFSRRDYPPGTPRTGPRTLEFRCVGDRLEATVTGATSEPITLTATDASLVSGPCAVVLKKGALLTKVEMQNLGATK
ncbi:MAG: hypothetical protein K1X78_25200 [Verrucomicrobiaceae bacterium]|nr:hypothetical protein [Verrucomicrobiaceae bacterium]